MFCCKDSNPCGVNEGNCGYDDQCFDNLLCGTDNCFSPDWDWAGCCYDPTGLQIFHFSQNCRFFLAWVIGKEKLNEKKWMMG